MAERLEPLLSIALSLPLCLPVHDLTSAGDFAGRNISGLAYDTRSELALRQVHQAQFVILNQMRVTIQAKIN